MANIKVTSMYYVYQCGKNENILIKSSKDYDSAKEVADTLQEAFKSSGINNEYKIRIFRTEPILTDLILNSRGWLIEVNLRFDNGINTYTDRTDVLKVRRGMGWFDVTNDNFITDSSPCLYISKREEDDLHYGDVIFLDETWRAVERGIIRD